jgi:3-isopropylmalate/(R)-2-methylmalate dehydratase small subunit
LLPIVQPATVIDQLFEEAKTEGYRLKIDLEAQTITTPSGQVFPFDVTEHRKHCLLNGLDEIGLTLAHADKIKAFETKHQAAQPWLFVK